MSKTVTSSVYMTFEVNQSQCGNNENQT